jgi:hypothetical protein
MKNVFKTVACGAVFAVAASTVPSLAFASGFAAVQDQDHMQHQGQDRQDYSNNEYYNQGIQDGYRDYQHKRHRAHRHKFANDEDRRAYESGYQQGLQGQRGDHHHDHHDDEHPQ